MKINQINISGNSQVIYAEKIDKIIYNGNSNLSPKEFDEFKLAIKEIPNGVLQAFKTEYEKEMEDAETVEQKETIGGKIKSFLVKNGISIAEKITTAVLTDYLKNILIKS